MDSAQRSALMSRIGPKDTKPEVLVRKALFERGYRYRLHDGRLPGRPDIVLPKWRTAIFVNGCFWHGHDCRLFRWPRSNSEFWRTKIGGNIERDRAALKGLEEMGWNTLVIWECQIRGPKKDLENRIERVVERVETALGRNSFRSS